MDGCAGAAGIFGVAAVSRLAPTAVVAPVVPTKRDGVTTRFRRAGVPRNPALGRFARGRKDRVKFRLRFRFIRERFVLKKLIPGPK